VSQRIIRVLEQGVLGIFNGFIVFPGKDQQAGQLDIVRRVCGVGVDGFPVRVDRLAELARTVKVGSLVNEGFGAGGWGRGWFWGTC
jgi:hypothetical protein